MAKTNPHGLTDQMFGFCQGYIRRGFKEAAPAYREAYPKCSEKAAESSASRLLRNAKVASYLASVQEKASKKTQLTADRVLEELSRLALSDITDFARWESGDGTLRIGVKDSDDLPPEISAAIKKVKINRDGQLEIELHSKSAAIDKAMRYLGLLTDRVEHTGKDGAPIEVTEVIIERPTKRTA